MYNGTSGRKHHMQRYKISFVTESIIKKLIKARQNLIMGDRTLINRVELEVDPLAVVAEFDDVAFEDWLFEEAFEDSLFEDLFEDAFELRTGIFFVKFAF